MRIQDIEDLAQKIRNAINSGTTEIAKSLISKMATEHDDYPLLDIVDFEERNLLMLAAKQGNLEIIDFILTEENHGTDIDFSEAISIHDFLGRNVIFHALESINNTSAVVDKLLTHVKSYRTIALYHQGKDLLLLKAIETNLVEVVTTILEKIGSQIIRESEALGDHMVLAMQKNNLAMFEALCRAGISIWSSYRGANSVIQYAFTHHPNFFEFICLNDKILNYGDHPPLIYDDFFVTAIKTNNFASLEILIRLKKIDLNNINWSGEIIDEDQEIEDNDSLASEDEIPTISYNKALMFAIDYHASDEIINFLLDNGADMDYEDHISGETPLSLSLKEENIHVARLLLERGANPRIDLSKKQGYGSIQERIEFANLIKTAVVTYTMIKRKKMSEYLQKFYNSEKFNHSLHQSILNRIQDNVIRNKILGLKLNQLEQFLYESEYFNQEVKAQLETYLENPLAIDLTRETLKFLSNEDTNKMLTICEAMTAAISRVEYVNLELVQRLPSTNEEERPAKRQRQENNAQDEIFSERAIENDNYHQVFCVTGTCYDNLLLNHSEIITQLYKLYDSETRDRIIDLCSDSNFARIFIESVHDSRRYEAVDA